LIRILYDVLLRYFRWYRTSSAESWKQIFNRAITFSYVCVIGFTPSHHQPVPPVPIIHSDAKTTQQQIADCVSLFDTAKESGARTPRNTLYDVVDIWIIAMSASFLSLLSLLLVGSQPSSCFVLPTGTNANHPVTFSYGAASTTLLWSSLKEKTDEKAKEEKIQVVSRTDSADSFVGEKSDVEGLPWWWELVWKLDIMKTGNQGEEIIFGDSANVLRTNIEQIYGGFPSLDGCPLAEGEITDIGDGTMFIGLQNYYKSYGSPYKLCFGPKSFLVISDPVQAKHLLRDANKNYDKVRTGDATVSDTVVHCYLCLIV
jgi:hypothetical protein